MTYHFDLSRIDSTVRDALGCLTGRSPGAISPRHRLEEDYLLDPLGLGALAEELNAAFIRLGAPLTDELRGAEVATAADVAGLVTLVTGRVAGRR